MACSMLRVFCNVRFVLAPLVMQAMYWLTGNGEDILTAQYMFTGLYVSLIAWVISIYRRAGRKSMPLWSILLVCASRR